MVAAAPDFDWCESNEPPISGRFEPFPASAEEGRAVAALLQVKPLLGRDVAKKSIERRRYPLVLHLATHGFFLEDSKPITPAEAAQVFSGRSLSGVALFSKPPGDPMLRSGLALA